jgi:Protein of unknown function (DUF998)
MCEPSSPSTTWVRRSHAIGRELDLRSAEYEPSVRTCLPAAFCRRRPAAARLGRRRTGDVGVGHWRVPARIAGICGLLAFVTVSVGWIAGGLAQPAAFSWADDDISDLGATTADSAWLYNQVGANVTGLLVVGLALGLWRALSPDALGRLGASILLVAGLGSFLDGIFRLDCRGIDAACTNDSWHAHAHKIESGVTAAALLAAPLALGLAFRRLPTWRDSWLPSIAAVPALIAANVVFSPVGAGAATRAATVVVFLWIAFVGLRLLQKHEADTRTAAAA